MTNNQSSFVGKPSGKKRKELAKMNKLLKKRGLSLLMVMALAVVFLFSFGSVAKAQTIYFKLLNAQQSDPNSAWWAGKSNLLFDHGDTGFPGSDDQEWDWWGFNKANCTGAGHLYFSEIEFDCHDAIGGGCNTPNCSEFTYYFKGLPCGHVDNLRVQGDSQDSTFDLTLTGAGPVFNVNYGDTVEVYGWALMKAIMRHTSDFSFGAEGVQASGGTYDSNTNELDAWVNINLDFVNPIPSNPNGMSEIDTQEAWVNAYEQKGFIIPNAEFTAWRGAGVPAPNKYMVPTYTLGTPPVGPGGIQYPDEYIINPGQGVDMGCCLDDLVDDRLGSVWSEIVNADYLYIAFSRDNFVIDDVNGTDGKKSIDGGNLTSINPTAWPILGKCFLNDEGVWIAAGYFEVPPPGPDLIILEKHEEWINQEAGTYKVHYTVKNVGDALAGASTTCLFIDEANQASQSCGALDPEQEHSGTFDGPFTVVGHYDTILVCADWGESCDGNGDVIESVETNNCLENNWIKNKADLIISEKSEQWINPANHSQGYKVHFTVTNQGVGPTLRSFLVQLKIDGEHQEHYIVDILNPDQSHNGTFVYTYYCTEGSDVIRVLADVGFKIDESDETNNCLTNRLRCNLCQGDFDGDCDVDSADNSIFSGEYGNGPDDCCVVDGDGCLINSCQGDFDGDCDVDSADNSIFSGEYGHGPDDCCPW